jgi:hypothetical protein
MKLSKLFFTSVASVMLTGTLAFAQTMGGGGMGTPATGGGAGGQGPGAQRLVPGEHVDAGPEGVARLDVVQVHLPRRAQDRARPVEGPGAVAGGRVPRHRDEDHPRLVGAVGQDECERKRTTADDDSAHLHQPLREHEPHPQRARDSARRGRELHEGEALRSW